MDPADILRKWKACSLVNRPLVLAVDNAVEFRKLMDSKVDEEYDDVLQAQGG